MQKEHPDPAFYSNILLAIRALSTSWNHVTETNLVGTLVLLCFFPKTKEQQVSRQDVRWSKRADQLVADKNFGQFVGVDNAGIDSEPSEFIFWKCLN